MSDRYLSCAETAKLVRAALKESFPAVKFSVRSSVYSGGASIRINWTDGPTSDQVKSITDRFEGAYFDGMIDYKGRIDHYLDGNPINFGASFIFEDRSVSDAAVKHALGRVCREYGLDYKPEYVEMFRNGKLYGIILCEGARSDEFSRQVNIALSEWSTVTTQQSATLARVSFRGSDEYGAPYGSRGYPRQGIRP